MDAQKPERCPICRDDVAGSSALPFCSERCRTVDLGNWLGETYRIPVEMEDESERGAPDEDES